MHYAWFKNSGAFLLGLAAIITAVHTKDIYNAILNTQKISSGISHGVEELKSISNEIKNVVVGIEKELQDQVSKTAMLNPGMRKANINKNELQKNIPKLIVTGEQKNGVLNITSEKGSESPIIKTSSDPTVYILNKDLPALSDKMSKTNNINERERILRSYLRYYKGEKNY